MSHGLFIFAALFLQSAESAKQVMRKEWSSKSDPSGAVDEVPRTTGISSVGGLTALGSKEDAAHRAQLKAHFTSLAQLRQNLNDVERIVTELEKEDVVDDDGFVKERVTMDERKVWLKEQKKQMILSRDASVLNKVGEEDDAGSAAFLSESDTSSVASGGLFGFWAKDRPHELRLDPDNMKVYSFSTFKLRYPYKHSWSLESLWKKLPKAPHRVRHNKQGGFAALIDEHNEPLIFTKDIHGYYHQGHKTPTAEEMLKASKPMDYQKLLLREGVTDATDSKGKSDDEEQYMVYQNQTSKIHAVIDRFKRGDKMSQENNREEMQHLRDDIRYSLNVNPKKREGRAGINVQGSSGSLCSFNVEIQHVTGQKLKERIEKEIGMPWEAQKLFYGVNEISNDEKLNKRMNAGSTKTIDLIEAKSAVVKEALEKRGKWKEAPKDKSEADHTITDVVSSKVAEEGAEEKSVEEKSAEKAIPTKPNVADASTVELGAKDDGHGDDEVVAPPHQMSPETAPAPPQILRRTLYVREEDGTIHIEKQEVASPGHAIAPESEYSQVQSSWSVIDRGIPLDVLLEKENEQDRPASLFQVSMARRLAKAKRAKQQRRVNKPLSEVARERARSLKQRRHKRSPLGKRH